MIKCPICQFDNEDGALFCEQCKSDLGAGMPTATVAGVMTLPASAVASVVADAASESVPMATIEAAPPAGASAVAVAYPMSETPPPAALPVEAAPTLPPIPEAASADIYQTMAPVGSTTQHGAPSLSGSLSLPPTTPLPAGAQPKLVVLRGLKINTEYPLYEGHNFVGRTDEKPVDVDLEDQEPPDRIWSSRQHALITFEDNALTIEDLNSSNGTFVNRTRVYPGQKRPLSVGDVVQIGTVQLKVKA